MSSNQNWTYHFDLAIHQVTGPHFQGVQANTRKKCTAHNFPTMISVPQFDSEALHNQCPECNNRFLDNDQRSKVFLENVESQ